MYTIFVHNNDRVIVDLLFQYFLWQLAGNLSLYYAWVINSKFYSDVIIFRTFTLLSMFNKFFVLFSILDFLYIGPSVFQPQRTQ